VHVPLIPRPQHPVVSAQRSRRTADAQLRIADRITAFAGSMTFVYLHAAGFDGASGQTRQEMAP
jgi:uncharacterized membrane protein